MCFWSVFCPPSGARDEDAEFENPPSAHLSTTGVMIGENTSSRTDRAVRLVPQYKKVSRSRCVLLRLTWQKSWTAVVQRCMSHPQEAFCVSEDTGRTALHLASFNHACPQYVAEALIAANPHALVLEDPKLGWTPLHHLCAFRGGTDHLVPLFCNKIQEVERNMPERCILVPKGASPLRFACDRNAPLGTIDALVRARRCSPWIGPVTGGEPYYTTQSNIQRFDSSPLRNLSEKRRDDLLNANELTLRKMKSLTIRTFGMAKSCLVGDNSRPPDDETTYDVATYDVWEKCMILLHDGSREASRLQNGTQCPVHIVFSLEKPCLTVARICLDMFPSFALERDSKGMVPLHHVLAHFSSETTDLLDLILSREPASAEIAFPGGSLPVTVALQKGLSWQDGVSGLVQAAPEVLQVKDPATHLYPFLAASSNDANLNTIYQLLRFSPDVVKLCQI